ncbi:MAG: HD domain-containing protein [Lewinellaceae bacterium]|nr:HD domain-containing protein [Saprospiraceae bacterium]MCB9311676.1 HD domain-containing protein [Lewinellaceae bacterium]
MIGAVAGKLGSPAYLVGGYVRDKMLGRDTKDLDIVCLGSGIALAEHVADQLMPRPHVTVFRRFGTAMLHHQGRELEFVGARKESYREDSRKPAVEEGSLEDDQFRRDFTINALAISLNDADFGNLLDPFNGIAHLSEKILKTPMDPGKTFSDDPLRMMRAIRFATQLGFTIEEETLQAIGKYKERIRIISQERITTELNKILEAPTPSIGFRLLLDTGLLDLILPELVELKGVEFKEGIGHKDNFYHTLQVVDNLCKRSDDLWLRWAALLHDIAKPATKRFDPEVGWTFHGHDALGANMVGKIFRKMRLPLDHKLKFVQKMVRMHLRPISLTQEDITDSAVRRLLFDAGEDLESLLMLCEADITSKNPKKVSRYLDNYRHLRQKLDEVEESDRLRNWQPPVSGELIMASFGIGPCREVGLIKTRIREAILDGEIDNNLEAATRLMFSEGRKLGLIARQTPTNP